MSFLRVALFTVPAVLLLGTLSANLFPVGNDNAWYASLARPSFEPPGWVFPVAWGLLYTALGVSLAMLIHARGARGRGLIIALFIAQLAVNYAWSATFFGAHQVEFALGLVVVMIVLTVILIPGLWRIRPLAGALLLPYLAWLCIAGALNYQIMVLNPNASSLAPPAGQTNIPIQ